MNRLQQLGVFVIHDHDMRAFDSKKSRSHNVFPFLEKAMVSHSLAPRAAKRFLFATQTQELAAFHSLDLSSHNYSPSDGAQVKLRNPNGQTI